MMKGKVVHPPRLRKRAVAAAAAAASVSMEAIEVSMNDDLSHSVYAKKKKLLTYLSCWVFLVQKIRWYTNCY